ncbi:MAG: putative Mg2+ transporter-C (MgtC) family protein [Pseudomonadota bacterium]|jgi:putative Mg2+ transporter-C (MgtC) family protein
MEQYHWAMAGHLLGALFAGGLIGLERSYQGRAAGFRTHALVCMASSMLMLVTLYQAVWFSGGDTVRIDPTRMAQGVMTGIGFLGAGVIMKDGVSVRGLTTAASIWTTAAVGILVGVGLYSAAVMSTIATIGVLSLFRWLERMMPTMSYADVVVSFDATQDTGPQAMTNLLTSQKFLLSNLAYALIDKGTQVEYRMVIRSKQNNLVESLSQLLKKETGMTAFVITPRGD